MLAPTVTSNWYGVNIHYETELHIHYSEGRAVLHFSIVAHVNLTVRQSVAALRRRTWSTLQEAAKLLAHVE